MDEVPPYLREGKSFLGRNKRGDPYNTEAEKGDVREALHPDVDRILSGKESYNREKMMEHFVGERPIPTYNPKKISFLFLRSGEESLINLKSESWRKHHHGKGIPPEHRTRKTCGEWVAFQAPVIAGQTFNHVEICYHDVCLRTSTDKTELHADMVFTSTISNNGPAIFLDKTHDKLTYRDAWTIVVDEPLFYESYTQMQTFVEENDKKFSYTFKWFLMLPFLDSCCFSTNCINTDNIYSCSRLAADCILSLKLGDGVFFHALREHRAVSPDDIYAIISRFAHMHVEHPREVKMNFIRARDQQNHTISATDDELAFMMRSYKKTNSLLIPLSDYSDADRTDEETMEWNRSEGKKVTPEKQQKRKEEITHETYDDILDERARRSKSLSFIDNAHEWQKLDKRKTNHFTNPIIPLRLDMNTYTITSEIQKFAQSRSKAEQEAEAKRLGRGHATFTGDNL